MTRACEGKVVSGRKKREQRGAADGKCARRIFAASAMHHLVAAASDSGPRPKNKRPVYGIQ